MTEFEYWELPARALNNVVRHCFRGILTNGDFDIDENFHEAVIQKFPDSGGRLIIVTKKGAQTAIEKYLIKSEKYNLESVDPSDKLDGKYLIALIDDGYTYRAPEGYQMDDTNWIRINTEIKRKNMTVGLIPLNDSAEIEIGTADLSTDLKINTDRKPVIEEEIETKPITAMHVFNTRTESQAGRLTLKMPTFNPDSESVIEVLDKLEKLLPMTGNQIQAVIVNFIQNSGLDHLLLSLTNDELTSFNKFRTAMINRYSQANNTTQFYLISQLVGEHELDLLARIQRAWLRLKGDQTFNKSDEGIISERFISALSDPTIRLKLREISPAYNSLAEKAGQLRLAREHEETQPGQIKEQITLLTKEIEKLKMTCKNCGLGHETINCRANQKMKAQFNKNQRLEKQPQTLRHFRTHYPKNQNSNTYNNVRFPPALKNERWPDNRKIGQPFNYQRKRSVFNKQFKSRPNDRQNYNQNSQYNSYKRGYNKNPTYKNWNTGRRTFKPQNTYYTGVEEPVFDESF